MEVALAMAVGAARAADAGATVEPLPARVDVKLQLPPANFVYLEAGQPVFGTDANRRWSGTPLLLGSGASAAATLGVSLIASTVIAAAEAAAAATAREAAGPVGATVDGLDLHAMALANLRQLSPPGSTQWVASPDPFPLPPPPPPADWSDRELMRSRRLQLGSPLQHLADRAKASEHEATLFVSLLPLFRGAEGKTYLQANAWLFNRAGQSQGEWSVRVMGPEAPDLDRPALIRWWADGRYARFLAHGVRAALLPVVEDITAPRLREERRLQLDRLMSRRFDESGRSLNPWRDYHLNALHMRTSVCALRPDAPQLRYRVERLQQANQWRAAFYCPDETFADWTVAVEPGVSSQRDFDRPAPQLLRAPQAAAAPAPSPSGPVP